MSHKKGFCFLEILLMKNGFFDEILKNFKYYISDPEIMPGSEVNDKFFISFAFKIPEPAAFHLFYNKNSEKYFYFEKPSENFLIAAFGNLLEISADGSSRILLTDQQINDIKKNYINNWRNANIDSVPLIYGGVKFTHNLNSDLWSDFSDSDWFIPEIIFYSKNNLHLIICNMFFRQPYGTLEQKFEGLLRQYFSFDTDDFIPEYRKTRIDDINTDKEKLRWYRKINIALQKISVKTFSKIVLSREVKYKLLDDPDLPGLIQQLRGIFKDCYIFAYKKKSSIFWGASPEKLAKIEKGWIEVDALAGSISRGKTNEEDIELSEWLLSSKKNLSEQKAVVDFISESLKDFSNEILYSETPVIKKLPNIQHLWTPIRAKLKSDIPLFSLLKHIHPTPAICGVPWSVALQSIIQMEGYSRGLYTGFIGWLNFENEGDFAIAIRCALIKNKILYAYAGSGIVEGSDPESEFEETQLKLKPILSLFEHAKKNKS